MILIIDNYDSFTYNLVQYLGEILLQQGKNPDSEMKVCRNDELTVSDIGKLNPQKIVISPGPCTPNEAGVSVPLINEFASRLPILGVCLGHQSIGQAFGGHVIRAPQIMHGKTSLIHHDSKGLFKHCENPFVATRYHSLIVDRSTLPDCLQVTAWTDDGMIMGLRHKQFEVHGVQFHPESILTVAGKTILKNFLEI